jgi:hypothetical protein
MPSKEDMLFAELTMDLEKELDRETLQAHAWRYVPENESFEMDLSWKTVREVMYVRGLVVVQETEDCWALYIATGTMPVESETVTDEARELVFESDDVHSVLGYGLAYVDELDREPNP